MPDEDDPLPTRVPLFPLPNFVLFPTAVMPLHIFEPRYRTMVADCLAGDGCFGMVLATADWEAQGHAPGFRPIGATGRIVRHEPMPDGRSNILVRGLRRFRLGGLHRERPYLVADVAYVEPPILPGGTDLACRARLREAFVRYLDRCAGDTREAIAALDACADADRAADFVCSCLEVTPPLRQAFLECLDPVARIAAVGATVEALLRASPAGPDPRRRGKLPGFSAN